MTMDVIEETLAENNIAHSSVIKMIMTMVTMLMVLLMVMMMMTSSTVIDLFSVLAIISSTRALAISSKDSELILPMDILDW